VIFSAAGGTGAGWDSGAGADAHATSSAIDALAENATR
jgi:hypothetical protein